MSRGTTGLPPYLPTWYTGATAERTATAANTVVAADGVRFRFADGSSVVDWSGAMFVNNVGLGRPGMAKVLADQAARMAWASPDRFADVRTRLVEDLRTVLPPSLTTVHFTVGGSDAIEAAMRAARKVTQRRNVLALSFAYHGDTMATESLSDGMTPYGDPRPWIVRAPSPYEWWERLSDWDAAFGRWLGGVEQALRRRGPRTFAAIVLEPIMGSLCCVPFRRESIRAARELADRHGIKIVADEVITGFGRCGTWWGSTAVGLEPDAMVFAKGLTGGYAPMGAAVFEDSWGRALMESGFPHGLTMSGHPLGCVAARETIRILKEEDLVARCARMGSVLGNALQSVRAAHPAVVRDVRGLGLLWAIELRGRRPWRKGVPHPASARTDGLRTTLRERGVHVYATPDGGSLVLSPPFTITEGDIQRFGATLDESLATLR